MRPERSSSGRKSPVTLRKRNVVAATILKSNDGEIVQRGVELDRTFDENAVDRAVFNGPDSEITFGEQASAFRKCYRSRLEERIVGC